jgi:hypothetical protein
VPAPFIDRFGWIIIVVLIIMMFGLIGYGFYKKKLIDIRFMLTKREAEEAREKTKAVFEALREEVDEKINLMKGGATQAQGEIPLEPEHVSDALRNALAVSEDTIEKEIDDVDKAIGG